MDSPSYYRSSPACNVTNYCANNVFYLYSLTSTAPPRSSDYQYPSKCRVKQRTYNVMSTVKMCNLLYSFVQVDMLQEWRRKDRREERWIGLAWRSAWMISSEVASIYAGQTFMTVVPWSFISGRKICTIQLYMTIRLANY